MIRTIKCATTLPELLFLCREYNILPVLTESVYLGLEVAHCLYEQHPEKKLALFDSNDLLEIVSYDEEKELPDYLKQRKFDYGYKINKETGTGEPINGSR